MKRCFNYKIVLFWFLLFFSKTLKTEAQIIVRLWEAEISAAANVAVLTLIRPAEERVKNRMSELIKELRKKTPYYNTMVLFNPIFEIDNNITRIRGKLSEINQKNNRVPLLFNRRKSRKERKYMMYTRYLRSLEADVGDADFSNNGNLLKTCLEIISELEEIEKDLDATLLDLNLSERLFNLF